MIEGRKVQTLLRRELQEYRGSLCWTPALMVLVLGLLMFLAVLLADQISAVGEAVSQVVPQGDGGSSRVSIHVDGGTGEDPPVVEYRVQQTQPADPQASAVPGSTAGQESLPAGSLNPLLNTIHSLFMLVLLLVSANYLLAALFSDRRDRSILFWKSMPVSEWQEVLAKYGIAMLVAPLLFVLASILAQLLCLLLGMLLLWRMEMDPYAALVDKLDFLTLFGGQLAAWPLMSLWLAPTYAWLLLASAGATRSPFMLAITPILALLLGERILLGSAGLAAVLSRHFPQLGSGVGAYGGFYWQGLADLPSLCLGLLFAAAALWLAVFLRRYYFEL